MDGRPSLSPPASPRRRSAARPRPPGWRGVQRWVRLPVGDLPIVLEAIAWIAGATALRLLADWLLTIQPLLWVPVALCLLMPAVLTISLSIWAPPLTLVLGYRLLLTAIGLVLGGRL
jgi:hypothetical protein